MSSAVVAQGQTPTLKKQPSKRKRQQEPETGKGSVKNQTKPKKPRLAPSTDTSNPGAGDPVRVAVASTTTPGARYEHGFMQLSDGEKEVTSRITPPALHVFPRRHEQTEAAITPLAAKPLAALLLERQGYPVRSAHGILRGVYAFTLLSRVATVLNDPRATPREARAARIVEATTVRQLQNAIDSDGVRILKPNTSQLLTSPTVKQQRSIRLVDPVLGPIQAPQAPPVQPSTLAALEQERLALSKKSRPTAKERSHAQYVRDRGESHLRFYAHDPEPDPDLEYGLRPNAYRTSQAILSPENRHDWMQIETRLREGASSMPRASVEQETMRYRQRYHYPVEHFNPSEQRRPCFRGLACRVYVTARARGREQLGYNPPEYKTPTQEREWNERRARGVPLSEEPPAGPCIECIDYNRSMRSLVLQNWLRVPPLVPINTTSVRVGEGEYSRDVMIPWEINGVRTGIEGHVPAYDMANREFGTDFVGPQRVPMTVLSEVNMDFHMSLDQTNACMGVRKARPLAGVTGKRWVFIPKSDPMLAVRDSAAWIPAASVSAETDNASCMWAFYTRTLPLPMLADRALVLVPLFYSDTANTNTYKAAPVYASRTPAVWLRQTVLNVPWFHRDILFVETPTHLTTTTTTTTTTNLLTAPVVHGLRARLPPSIAKGLAGAFGFDVNTEWAKLESVLHRLASHAFSTFERSMVYVLRSAPDDPLVRVPLLLFFESARYGTWARAAFEEASAFRRPPGWDPERSETWRSDPDCSWVLWTTCVWRIAVAYLFARVIRPWWKDGATIYLFQQYGYVTHQFVCTHLDFLSVCTAFLTADYTNTTNALRCHDAWWLSVLYENDEPRLTRVYPQCTRVVCGEEMPDEKPLRRAVNPFYDMPSKKTHGSKQGTMAHGSEKVQDHNCMTRGIDDVFDEAMKNYPVLTDYYMLILRCALMGGYLTAHGRPELPALLRINTTLAPRTALLEDVTSDMVTTHRMRIRQWIVKHPLVTRNLLREHYVFMVELSGVYDDLFAQTRNWHMLKAVMRQCNTQIRRAVNTMALQDIHQNENVDLENIVTEHDKLSQEEKEATTTTTMGADQNNTQTHEKEETEYIDKMVIDHDWMDDTNDDSLDDAQGNGGDTDAPITWETLEYRPGKTSYGEIQKWHDRQKDHNTKLFKAPELVLLARKMKPVETALIEQKMFDVEEARAFLKEDERDVLLHIIAYQIAHQLNAPLPDDGCARPAFPTGMLKIVGMSKKSHQALREWLHASAEYHAPDDSFTKLTWQMAQRSWRDFVLLRVLISLVEHYSDMVVSFLSEQTTRYQWFALRASMGLMPYNVMPPRIGYACYCRGCTKWGHAIAQPSREYQGLARQNERRRHSGRMRGSHALKRGRQRRLVADKRKGALATLHEIYEKKEKETEKDHQDAAEEQADEVDGFVAVRQKLQDTKAKILKQYKDKHPRRPFPPKPFYICDGQAACFANVMYNPLDTKLYCARGTKLPGLDNVIDNPESSSDEEEEDEDEEEEVEVEVEVEEEKEDGEDDASVGHDEEEEVEDDEIMRQSRENSDDEDDDNGDDMDVDTPPDTTATSIPMETVEPTTTRGKKNTKKIDFTRLLMDLPTCRSQSMMEIDLVGVCKRQQKRLYVLCSYCGCKCDAVASNMTNIGMSCGEHAIVDEYPLWHRLWRHIIRPLHDETPNGKMEEQRKRLLPRMCEQCGHHDLKGTSPIWVYDHAFRFKELHFCRFHMASLRPVLPRPAYGEQLIPVPIDIIKKQLALEIV